MLIAATSKADKTADTLGRQRGRWWEEEEEEEEENKEARSLSRYIAGK